MEFFVAIVIITAIGTAAFVVARNRRRHPADMDGLERFFEFTDDDDLNVEEWNN